VDGHPVQLTVSDDSRRSRVTVLFRPLLALPHVAWLAFWTPLALLAALANGVAILAQCRSAAVLHRFLAAYVRYVAQLYAFTFLVANPFPGFTGTLPYPVDIAVAGPDRQRRMTALLRPILGLPALVVAAVLAAALAVVGGLAWLTALATGRTPAKLRDRGAGCIRFLARTHAYHLLLTDSLPWASPPTPAETPL
jgi:hypothetical protein